MSDDSKRTLPEAREPLEQSNTDLSSAKKTLAPNHDVVVEIVSDIEQSCSRNAHRNYLPFSGKHGIRQSCLSAYQDDSRYLYFDSDFSGSSFPEFLCSFNLTVVERYKKTDS